MHESSVRDHVAARSQRQDEGADDHPYAAKTLPSVQLYNEARVQGLDAWLTELKTRDEAPTPEQSAFLSSVVKRLALERQVETRREARSEDGEPLFDMVHGVPGAGKSKLIGWLREAFEEILGWTHGVQFVCLAFQNAMAALIGGYTIHHWTGISVGDADGMGTTRDAHRFQIENSFLRAALFPWFSASAGIN